MGWERMAIAEGGEREVGIVAVCVVVVCDMVGEGYD